MADPIRRLGQLLLEPADPQPSAPGQESPAGSRQRLSRLGQLALGAAIGSLGLVAYLGSWALSERMERRLAICLRLDTDAPSQVAAVPSLIPLQSPNNLLAFQYRLNQHLIADLPAARPGQRLRLQDQLNTLVNKLDQLCRLATFNRSQEAGLMTVATGAACIIVLAGVVRAQKGLQTISRSEQAILFSACCQLVLSLSFLQLGDQEANARTSWQAYQDHLRLLALLSSSLSNQQQLLPPTFTLAAPPTTGTPLSDPQSVGSLVSHVDGWLLTIPSDVFHLNGSFAEKTLTHTLARPRQDSSQAGDR